MEQEKKQWGTEVKRQNRKGKAKRTHWSQQTLYFNRKHSISTTPETTLDMDITRWSILKSDWLYYLQPKIEKLYTVTLFAPGPRRKEQWPHKRLIQTCAWVSGSLRWRHGQQRPAARSGPLSVALPAWDPMKEVTIVFITSTVVWLQVQQQGGNTAPPINRKLDWRFTEHSLTHQNQFPPQLVSPIRKLP